MVKGAGQLHARLKRVPAIVRRELELQLEKEATKLVAEMNVLKPLQEIEINWTWGDAPKGSLKIGTVKGKEFGKIAITIYAVGDGFSPEWFEFGTKPRFHDSGQSTGQILASPFFWPVYRSNKKRVRAGLTRAVNRAMRKA